MKKKQVTNDDDCCDRYVVDVCIITFFLNYERNGIKYDVDFYPLPVVYSSWEEVVAKLPTTVSLKVGNETKKVPIYNSPDGTYYLVRVVVFSIYMKTFYWISKLLNI